MKSPEILKAVEEKLNQTLDEYIRRNRNDSALHQQLVDDLKNTTQEFLEARRRA